MSIPFSLGPPGTGVCCCLRMESTSFFIFLLPVHDPFDHSRFPAPWPIPWVWYCSTNSIRYFSKLERLRPVQALGISSSSNTSKSPSVNNFVSLPGRTAIATPISSNGNKIQQRAIPGAGVASPRASRSHRYNYSSLTDTNFCSELVDKIKRRHLFEDEQLPTIRPHAPCFPVPLMRPP